MGNPPPTLDYAAAKPHRRARKWARRTALGVLILACLYATPVAWLYWGWKQEQPARRMVARVGGKVYRSEPAGPAFLERYIPGRLDWVRDRITAMDLRATPITDEDLRTIRRLSRLRYLILDRTRVTDAGLVHLQGLRGVEGLWLSGTGVTGPGLLHLKGFRRLVCLDLSGTPLRDEGLVHLERHTGMQELILTGTNITDGGLVHLRGLAGLKVLWLNDTRVSDIGAAELHEALPRCAILR